MAVLDVAALPVPEPLLAAATVVHGLLLSFLVTCWRSLLNAAHSISTHGKRGVSVRRSLPAIKLLRPSVNVLGHIGPLLDDVVRALVMLVVEFAQCASSNHISQDRLPLHIGVRVTLEEQLHIGVPPAVILQALVTTGGRRHTWLTKCLRTLAVIGTRTCG